MRSAEMMLGRFEDRRHVPPGPTLQTPKSSASTPVVFAPHPPLMSGGWYQSTGREIVGPGRYPVPRPQDKTAGSALLWTFFFGPLGLCYLSTTAGLLSAGLTAGLLVLAGSALPLAVIWPLVMVLSVLASTNRR